MRKPISQRVPDSTFGASETGAAGAAIGGDSGSKPQIKAVKKPLGGPKQSPAAEAVEKKAHAKETQKSGATDGGKARLRGVK